jgi:hypothetical protein
MDGEDTQIELRMAQVSIWRFRTKSTPPGPPHRLQWLPKLRLQSTPYEPSELRRRFLRHKRSLLML